MTAPTLAPCPRCKGTDLELVNTWTALYWVECACGIEFHASLAGGELAVREEDDPVLHRAARRLTIKGWNKRR